MGANACLARPVRRERFRAKAAVSRVMISCRSRFIAVELMPGEINVDACPWWLALFALVFVVACGSPSSQPSSTPEPTPDQRRQPPPPLPGESTITGSITYEGTAEKPRVVRMDSDPLCMPEGPTTSEVLIVGPGNGLQNAFV